MHLSIYIHIHNTPHGDTFIGRSNDAFILKDPYATSWKKGYWNTQEQWIDRQFSPGPALPLVLAYLNKLNNTSVKKNWLSPSKWKDYVPSQPTIFPEKANRKIEDCSSSLISRSGIIWVIRSISGFLPSYDLGIFCSEDSWLILAGPKPIFLMRIRVY